MKRTTFVLLFVCVSLVTWCNNIQISNVSLTGQNVNEEYTLVEFDITWENSWRLVAGPANWDAAWVFIKYRVGEAGEWKHAWLHNTGHVAGSNTSISVGLLSPELAYNSSTNAGMGAFIYRSQVGSGTFTSNNVQLRWNYGENAVNDVEQVDIKVFAIEHVYIPQGSFYIGSGGTENYYFYAYGSNDPYAVISEGAITVGQASGNLYYAASGGFGGDQVGPIPSTYPKGYRAFYVMKYEVSQQGYADFLNTLTRQQQGGCVNTDISSTSVPNRYVLSNTNSILYRNGIVCRSNVPPSPAPIIFFCDMNSFGNSMADGQDVACNYLRSNLLASYLDWAGLRIMTELEFEKCARGPNWPVANEYPWGNQVIIFRTQLLNQSLPNELPADTLANINYANFNYQNDPSVVVGPMRSGAFAGPGRTRTESGAGFYGCMDLGGNVWEKIVTVGNPAGRSYEGIHGNGLLTAAGRADVQSWPDPTTTIGFGLRAGGYFEPDYNFPRTSDRTFSTEASTSTILPNRGGRGCRTAPQ